MENRRPFRRYTIYYMTKTHVLWQPLTETRPFHWTLTIIFQTMIKYICGPLRALPFFVSPGEVMDVCDILCLPEIIQIKTHRPAVPNSLGVPLLVAFNFSTK